MAGATCGHKRDPQWLLLEELLGCRLKVLDVAQIDHGPWLGRRRIRDTENPLFDTICRSCWLIFLKKLYCISFSDGFHVDVGLLEGYSQTTHFTGLHRIESHWIWKSPAREQHMQPPPLPARSILTEPKFDAALSQRIEGLMWRPATNLGHQSRNHGPVEPWPWKPWKWRWTLPLKTVGSKRFLGLGPIKFKGFYRYTLYGCIFEDIDTNWPFDTFAMFLLIIIVILLIIILIILILIIITIIIMIIVIIIKLLLLFVFSIIISISIIIIIIIIIFIILSHKKKNAAMIRN